MSVILLPRLSREFQTISVANGATLRPTASVKDPQLAMPGRVRAKFCGVWVTPRRTAFYATSTRVRLRQEKMVLHNWTDFVLCGDGIRRRGARECLCEPAGVAGHSPNKGGLQALCEVVEPSATWTEKRTRL